MSTFNQNLKTIGAGQNQGPFTIGNIGSYNGRTIFNFGFKTIRTPEGKNATYSVPSDWKKATEFQTGDAVLIDISDDGFIKQVRRAPIQKPNVLAVAKAADAMLADGPETQVDEDVKETAPAAVDSSSDDLPF
jgi:hypothetical protein